MLTLFLTLLLASAECNCSEAGNAPAPVAQSSTSRNAALRKFVGSYALVTQGYMESGMNDVYEMQLDPVSSRCRWVEDGFCHITNSKGWCGSLMQAAEAWEVISFNLHNSHRHAIVEMRKVADMFGDGITKTCKVKLQFDDYDNLVMTYLSGNGAPAPLVRDNGTYGSATFTKE